MAQTTRRLTRKQYRDADRLLRLAIWRQGAHAAALQAWIEQTKPAPRWRIGRRRA